MRLNNHKTVGYVKTIAISLITLIILDLVVSSLSGSLGNYFNSHWLAISSIAILVIIALFKVSYFDIEGEFEIVHVRSGSILKYPLSKKTLPRVEFPKAMLRGYQIKNRFLFKQLYLLIDTNNGQKLIGGYVLTGMSEAKVRGIFNEDVSAENLGETISSHSAA